MFLLQFVSPKGCRRGERKKKEELFCRRGERKKKEELFKSKVNFSSPPPPWGVHKRKIKLKERLRKEHR